MRIKLSKTLKQLALGSALVVLSSTAFAASDGTTGFTSTGTIFIDLIVNEEVKISNLIDIPLGVFAGVDAVGTSPACIYRNGGTGLYTITATGSGAASAFTLNNGPTTVAYGVEFNDGSGLSSLIVGGPLAATGASGVDNDCGGGGAGNSTVQVTVLAADAAVLPALTYSGTLTLIVAPN